MVCPAWAQSYFKLKQNCAKIVPQGTTAHNWHDVARFCITL
ncbi:hypothetical protein F3D3_1017 [Fusibacter sp. 3D3]|nr:hypothetical protein F3D3_1017 [Fusibacter sp. 3D3]